MSAKSLAIRIPGANLLDARHAALDVNKAAIVSARLAGDDNLAAELSQKRQALKSGWCRICGIPLTRAREWPGKRCRMHQEQLLSMKSRRWLDF